MMSKPITSILILAILFCLPFEASASTTPLDEVAIQAGGRKKPFLVFAQETLRSISGKVTFAQEDKKLPAVGVVTSIWREPGAWRKTQLILVNHRPLKEALNLQLDRKLFSYTELAANQKLLELLGQAEQARRKGERLQGLLKETADLGMRLAEFEGLASGASFTLIPTDGPRWITIPEWAEAGGGGAASAMLTAIQEGDWSRLAGELKALDRAALRPGELRKLEIETQYQRLHPFRWAWIAYAAAAIILGLTASKLRKPGYEAAWLLVAAGFALQVYGFYARCVVAGRPPVTNMYESVIWVAFGCILFAAIFELIYRSRTFFAGALPVAVVALILADTQPLILDQSIQPLVPVLRDNFWLTTHVLTITLSYAAFALAMGLGHMALGRAIVGRKTSPAFYNYLYRALQIGVLLLAIGTILGGVWANYSWGRFWGWDPKETWALIALLSYLIVLHGRVAGSWGGFGLAVGSVVAFLSVLMAWYGVNFVLGAGLHSYGFGSGGFPVVGMFVAADLAFVAFAAFRHIALQRKEKEMRPTARMEVPA